MVWHKCIYIMVVFLLFSALSADSIYLGLNSFEAKKPYIIKEIKQNIPARDTITYTQVPRGIILSVAQTEIFDGNSDIISDNGQFLLREIAKLLTNFDNNCTIEAHTEELILNNTVYKEDWEISIVRANAIAKYISTNLGVEPSRLFPIGFGKIMPFKENVAQLDFPDNRIDFVIFDYSVVR